MAENSSYFQKQHGETIDPETITRDIGNIICTTPYIKQDGNLIRCSGVFSYAEKPVPSSWPPSIGKTVVELCKKLEPID
jgi:hypothetical protein